MKLEAVKRSALLAMWFILLTFPVMVVRVNTVTGVVQWRWSNLVLVGLGSFVISLVWNWALARTAGRGGEAAEAGATDEATGGSGLRIGERMSDLRTMLSEPRYRTPAYALLAVVIVAFPFVMSLYQTNIMISALVYVMLALGLNIVIGLGGMLHLGYIAFYLVGAYTYGILNRFFGIGFWVALPIGAALSVVAGILLALPVLRLRGDYLAIVTLGFGEIARIVMNNTTKFSGGPQGIGGIPRPTLFGLEMGLLGVTRYTYYIIVVVVIITVFVVYRFENSRIGRALAAMGEDEIAAQAMGVDLTRMKLTAFALGSVWAGIGGVILAARTTFINPASFTVWESVIVLCCVVLGGMGSIPGAIVGALALILVPEYLRAFSDYRMLMFGAVLVVMMVFRPGGLIPKRRRSYTVDVAHEEEVVS